MIPETDIQKGDILISKPTILGDVTFNRAVILIVDFNAEGVVGFMVNKPINDKLNDLLPHVNKEFKVFDGGPVERDKLYFIHNVPDLIPGSLKIKDDIFWGGHLEDVLALIEDGVVDTTQIKFFLGYSGWGQFQLENEIKDDVWLRQIEMKSQDIITCQKAEFWNEKIKAIGGEYLIWSNAPENPNYN